MLEGVSKAFRSGYEVRNQYVEKTQQKIALELNDLEEVQTKVTRLSEELERLKTILTAEENVENKEKAAIEADAMDKAMKVLGIDKLSTIDGMIDFAVGVMDVLGLTSPEDVKKVVDSGEVVPRNPPQNPPQSTDQDSSEDGDSLPDDGAGYHGDMEDSYHDHHEHAYGEDGYEASNHAIEDNEVQPEETPSVPDGEKKGTTCNLGSHSLVIEVEVLLNYYFI